MPDEDIVVLNRMRDAGEIDQQQYEALRSHLLWGTPLPGDDGADHVPSEPEPPDPVDPGRGRHYRTDSPPLKFGATPPSAAPEPARPAVANHFGGPLPPTGAGTAGYLRPVPAATPPDVRDQAAFLASLLRSFEAVWARVRGRMRGMTDEEYLWLPATRAWTVSVDDGRPRVQRLIPEPIPPPLTTIAWRSWHLGSECLDGIGGRLFGYPPEFADRMQWVTGVADSLSLLDSQWRKFRNGLAGIDAVRIRTPVGSAFRWYAEETYGDVLLHIADEVSHHGAEIALLRDLYASGLSR